MAAVKSTFKFCYSGAFARLIINGVVNLYGLSVILILERILTENQMPLNATVSRLFAPWKAHFETVV